ncbi:glycosyltransferase [Paenibacillus sp. H1-7]|uniref:glycosyltransferase n=1 Tax=Paenibacillus sp. H1-7 TaxID=2282849 RepID=UPI001EF998A8|nr:glycosyltransferase [Paenibacillus sp. H1-7]ULL13895.1 glycosyltransferase [Paenibacillus sp. H1-7]
MSENVRVSVIIPVYNAAQHIPRCMDSLLNQTLRECEFIFVNDGSQDNSGDIIEQYRRKDPRIRLIQQPNEGVSAARNAGLRAAVGEYTGFVDADDYVAKDMFATLYKAAEQKHCDVVISNVESELEGHKAITTYPFPIDTVLTRDYIEQEIMTFFLQSDQMNAVWNKLYRSQLIREHAVKFPYKVALGEDGLFNMQFFRHAGSAVYIDYTGYFYQEVAGSATRNMKQKDYFARAVEVYRFEMNDNYMTSLDPGAVERLKSIKLIHNVMSLIYMYFNAADQLSLGQRWKQVHRMIGDPHVREALPHYYREKYSGLGSYNKFILNMIQRKSIVGLYCATAYSRFRNRA